MSWPLFSMRKVMAVPLAYALIFAFFRGLKTPIHESFVWEILAGTGLAGITLFAPSRSELRSSLITIAVTILAFVLILPDVSPDDQLHCFVVAHNDSILPGRAWIWLESKDLILLGIRAGLLGWAIHRVTQCVLRRQSVSFSSIALVAMLWGSLIVVRSSDFQTSILKTVMVKCLLAFIVLAPLRQLRGNSIQPENDPTALPTSPP